MSDLLLKSDEGNTLALRFEDGKQNGTVTFDSKFEGTFVFKEESGPRGTLELSIRKMKKGRHNFKCDLEKKSFECDMEEE